MCKLQIAELGHGTFGIVIKAWDMRTQPPTEVAIKMLPRGDFVGALPLALAHHTACCALTCQNSSTRWWTLKLFLDNLDGD